MAWTVELSASAARELECMDKATKSALCQTQPYTTLMEIMVMWDLVEKGLIRLSLGGGHPPGKAANDHGSGSGTGSCLGL